MSTNTIAHGEVISPSARNGPRVLRSHGRKGALLSATPIRSGSRTLPHKLKLPVTQKQAEGRLLEQLANTLDAWPTVVARHRGLYSAAQGVLSGRVEKSPTDKAVACQRWRVLSSGVCPSSSAADGSPAIAVYKHQLHALVAGQSPKAPLATCALPTQGTKKKADTPDIVRPSDIVDYTPLGVSALAGTARCATLQGRREACSCHTPSPTRERNNGGDFRGQEGGRHSSDHDTGRWLKDAAGGMSNPGEVDGIAETVQDPEYHCPTPPKSQTESAAPTEAARHTNFDQTPTIQSRSTKSPKEADLIARQPHHSPARPMLASPWQPSNVFGCSNPTPAMELSTLVKEEGEPQSQCPPYNVLQLPSQYTNVSPYALMPTRSPLPMEWDRDQQIKAEAEAADTKHREGQCARWLSEDKAFLHTLVKEEGGLHSGRSNPDLVPLPSRYTDDPRYSSTWTRSPWQLQWARDQQVKAEMQITEAMDLKERRARWYSKHKEFLKNDPHDEHNRSVRQYSQMHFRSADRVHRYAFDL